MFGLCSEAQGQRVPEREGHQEWRLRAAGKAAYPTLAAAISCPVFPAHVPERLKPRKGWMLSQGQEFWRRCTPALNKPSSQISVPLRGFFLDGAKYCSSTLCGSGRG